MPNTNDFKKNKKSKHSSKVEKQLQEGFPKAQTPEPEESRPSFSVTMEATSEEEVTITAEAPQSEDPRKETEPEAEKFQFNFAGSDILRSRAPKAVELAEKVTGDWISGGDFSDLPINQPLVQYYLGEGLRKAKQTEKQVIAKVESSNVVPVAKMVAESLISKILKK